MEQDTVVLSSPSFKRAREGDMGKLAYCWHTIRTPQLGSTPCFYRCRSHSPVQTCLLLQRPNLHLYTVLLSYREERDTCTGPLFLLSNFFALDHDNTVLRVWTATCWDTWRDVSLADLGRRQIPESHIFKGLLVLSLCTSNQRLLGGGHKC